VARVVIVDDNLLCRTLLRSILSNGGHDVVGEARDGTQAPVCVHELRPELVTLDLVMPGRGGLATLEHLLMVDPSLAVVVCSASLDQRRVLAALRLGAKGFVVKPFDHLTVLDAVRSALAETDSNAHEIERGEVLAAGAGTGSGSG
jgi:two-component system chemotaxis response regulator CheY